jgi:hypothetical protein
VAQSAFGSTSNGFWCAPPSAVVTPMSAIDAAHTLNIFPNAIVSFVSRCVCCGDGDKESNSCPFC